MAEVFFFLGVGASDEEGGCAEHVGDHRGGDTDAAVGDLFADEDVVEFGEAEAAELFGDADVHEAQFPGFFADVHGEGAVLVEFARDGDDVFGGEVAAHFDEVFLFLGEAKVEHGEFLWLR